MSESQRNTDEVRDYYDQFASYQSWSGINDRHASIRRWLRRFGMKRGDSVLEVGCGVGQITQLMAEMVGSGSITAVDISPENIRLASSRLKSHANIEWMVSDMVNIHFSKSYDWVVFPDVLEHIPVDLHESVFATIAAALKPSGKVFIHIPHPIYQDYIWEHEPDKLQIIDQSLSAAEMARVAEMAGLSLEHFESYALYRKPADYQAILFKMHAGVPKPELKPYWSRVIQRLRLRGLRK